MKSMPASNAIATRLARKTGPEGSAPGDIDKREWKLIMTQLSAFTRL